MFAKSIQSKNRDEKVIFGGKYNLQKRMLNKMSKEDWQSKRLLPLNIQGEACKNGNRHFTLNITDSNSIVFKPKQGQKFTLELPKLRKNYLKKLILLEASSKLSLQPFQIQLSENHIFISFDEVKEPSKQKVIENRFIGIDLNPSSIGVSVIENLNNQDVKVLHTVEYSISQIIKEIKSLKLASNNRKVKYLNNKLNYETIEISKSISNLALQFNCKGIFIEDLNFKEKQESNNLNRINKNLWKRCSLASNLEKRCKLNDLTFYKVSPQYSSQIGNLMYEFSDPINASIEIARRGAQIIFEKDKSKRKFYPEFKISSLKDQWKEQFSECKDWKDIFFQIKNSGLKYRVSFDQLIIQPKVFSLKCVQSKVFYHTCS
jgi:hypothetical protein